MNCKSCGMELALKEGFCPECGTKITEKKEVSPVEKKKFFTPLRLFLLSIALVLLLGGGIGYFFLTNASSAQSVVEDFKQAVENEDAIEIAELMNSTEAEWDYTEEDAEMTLTYLIENPDAQATLFEKLEEHAILHDEHSNNANRQIENRNDPPFASISLVQSGKRWGIFDEYSLSVSPVSIHVVTDEDNVNLTINGKELEMEVTAYDDNALGLHGPGSYEIKGVISNPYVDIELNETITLFESSRDDEIVQLNYNLRTVEAAALYDNTRLYINGEETDIILDEEHKEIGDFLVDGSLIFTYEREFPWGIITSDDVPVNDTPLHIEDLEVITEDVQAEMMELINETWIQRTEALVSGNTSSFTHASEELRERTEEFYEELSGRRGEYTANVESARYRTESIEYPVYNESEDRYELEVEVEFTVYEPDVRTYALLREDDYNTTTYYITTYYDEDNEEWSVDNYRTGSFFILTNDQQESFEF